MARTLMQLGVVFISGHFMKMKVKNISG